jgi:ubiquinone/menaquinone biosynthesis C-methylase UbiE
MKFTPSQFISLRKAYDQGINLTNLISSWGIPIDFEIISIIYDFQSGTYTKNSNENPAYINAFTSEIVDTLCNFIEEDMTVLDCGTGEGTTIIPILKKLGMRSGYGIDASISRVLWAQCNAVAAGINLNLAVSDLGQLPLSDNAVDVVVTVHALEPNHGREIELIKELGRVARRFMFLIEPDFEKASKLQKERMIKLGYIRGIDEAIKKNNFRILEKVSIVNNSNELNVAQVTVVDTGKTKHEKSNSTWVNPIHKDQLTPYMNGLRSTLGLWFPQVNSIPLLRSTDAQYLLSPPDQFR